MNIIIAGDGEVGFYLAQALVDSNHDITIVDPHELQSQDASVGVGVPVEK